MSTHDKHYLIRLKQLKIYCPRCCISSANVPSVSYLRHMPDDQLYQYAKLGEPLAWQSDFDLLMNFSHAL